MTPEEQIQFLKSYAEKKPNARLGAAIHRLSVIKTADELKPSYRPQLARMARLQASVRASLGAVVSALREGRS